jgi:hypothetical protein
MVRSCEEEYEAIVALGQLYPILREVRFGYSSYFWGRIDEMLWKRCGGSTYIQVV